MTYVYDANGNIVSKTPYTNVTSSDLSTATQGTAIIYGYGDGNWSDKLTSYDGQTITYDASGNPTSYRGETVTWNGRLMTSYTKDDRRYEYSYNSDGMRTVKKVYENNELVYTYTYIWDGDVLLAGRMEVTDADEPISIRYLYDDSGELYGMDYNGNGYFAFIKNLQGDIVSIVPLDSESNVEVNMEYDAWGKPIIKQASSAAEGFLIAVMMLVTNVGYRGYFYDFETGLYYLRSRYYDPEIGRFINADDTAFLGYDSSPLSMNIFAYCENNPVNNCDYLGNCFLNSKGYVNHDNWEINRKYAAKKAIEYAKTWWNKRNKSYYTYRKNDCTNFVSQCLFVGGLLMSNTWYSFCSNKKPSNKNSYHYDKWTRCISNWNLKYYRVSDAWSVAPKLYSYLKAKFTVKKYSGKNSKERQKAIKNAIKNNKIKVGDVAFLENQDGLHHAMLIGKVINNKNTVDAYYYAHTDDHCADNNASIIKASASETVYIVSMGG